jgi:hypothetical protein
VSAALLFDNVARIARHEAMARAVASAGVVTGVFAYQGTADHAVSVRLRDTGVVLPRVPIAVGALGFAAIPAVDDLVLVTFLEGELDAPVVVGRLYHPDLDPPKHKPGQLALRLPPGESSPKLECEIEGDPARLQLKLPGDVKIEIVEDTVTVTVGEIELKLAAAGGGRLEAKAGGAELTMKKDGDISLKTSGKLSLEGSEIEIKGQSKVKVSGGTVELN